MSLNLSVKLRKPTRVLDSPWEGYVSSLVPKGQTVRGREYDHCYFDGHAGAVMLDPKVDPGNWTYGKNGYALYVYSGGTWQYKPDAFVEGEAAFGDIGHYVGFAGTSDYPATTPWAAYRNRPVQLNYPLFFAVHWTPPAGTYLPQLEFWPRVDFTRSWTTEGGITYYYAPLSFRIDAQSESLSVCEYEFDGPQLDLAPMLTKTYQHPLDMGFAGFSGGWFTFKLLPVIERRSTDATRHLEDDDPLKVWQYRHDFVLKSPMLKGGGFLYRTKIERLTSLFPYGCPGIRSFTGGVSMLTMAPIRWPNTGYVVSPVFSKREANADYPTVEGTEYIPTGGASIEHKIVRPGPENTQTPVEIPVGTEFQQYRIQSILTPTSDDGETPILYKVRPQIAGSAEDRVQDELDISDDVIISESMDDDLTGYKATIKLRNRNGQYNHLIYRPTNEITFSLGGVERAVIYTADGHFDWWQGHQQEALFLVWEGGDFWYRMGRMRVDSMPDYGGWSIPTAVTDYFERIGFQPSAAQILAGATSKVHIAASLDGQFLPYSPAKDDPMCKPQDGSTANEFIEELRDRYFSTYPTGFDGIGHFWISEPLDAHNPANISRTFYLSRAQAEAAGDADPYFCLKPQVTFQHTLHYNEIWVWGLDPITQEPILDMWVDARSQTDETWPYYVGERRITVAQTRLPTLVHVRWYRDELVKIFSVPRRKISFQTKFDPYLMPKDLIKFYGLGFVFQVTSTGVDIVPEMVSKLHDDTVHGCQIEAVEYPL